MKGHSRKSFNSLIFIFKLNITRSYIQHLHLELDERLDNMSEGWLTGVEVRGHHAVDQRSGVDLVGHGGGGLHDSLHHRGVMDSGGSRQDKGSNWGGDGSSDWSSNWSNGSERSKWSNWSWSSDERSSHWDSLTNRVDETILR